MVNPAILGNRMRVDIRARGDYRTSAGLVDSLPDLAPCVAALNARLSIADHTSDLVLLDSVDRASIRPSGPLAELVVEFRFDYHDDVLHFYSEVFRAPSRPRPYVDPAGWRDRIRSEMTQQDFLDTLRLELNV